MRNNGEQSRARRRIRRMMTGRPDLPAETEAGTPPAPTTKSTTNTQNATPATATR